MKVFSFASPAILICQDTQHEREGKENIKISIEYSKDNTDTGIPCFTDYKKTLQKTEP